MPARQRKLRMEQMESRQLMAVTALGDFHATGVYELAQPSGDIAAYVQDGNLYINEASGFSNTYNGLRLIQLSPGHIRVMGAESNDGTDNISTVNGQAYQDFIVNHSVFINTGGGSDRVQIGFEGGNGALLINELHINTAAPQPVIAYSTLGGTVGTFNVPDNDQIFVWSANTRGRMNVNTGEGSDWLFVGKDVTIGDGIGFDNLTVNTGSGADQVTMKGAWVRGNVDLQMYSALSETDADIVYFDSILGQKTLVSGSVNVRMGGGDDMIFSTNPVYADYQVWALGIHSLGSMTFDLGAGNDTAYLRNLRVGGNLVVWGGAGADSVEMRQTPIDGEFGIAAAVNGDMYMQMYASANETDADSITTNAVGINGGFTALLGAGNDTLRLTDFTSFRTINLDAGAGNDAFDLVRTMAVENFFAALGEGDDSLSIMDLFQPIGLTRIDGGAGYDRLNKSGAFPAARLEQAGWEVINGRRQDLLGIKLGTFTMR